MIHKKIWWDTRKYRKSSKKNKFDKVLAIVAKFADFSRPFLTFSLSKSIILLNLFFLLLFRYLHVSDLQNFLVNHFFRQKLRKQFASKLIFANKSDLGHKWVTLQILKSQTFSSH